MCLQREAGNGSKEVFSIQTDLRRYNYEEVSRPKKDLKIGLNYKSFKVGVVLTMF